MSLGYSCQFSWRVRVVSLAVACAAWGSACSSSPPDARSLGPDRDADSPAPHAPPFSPAGLRRGQDMSNQSRDVG
jgi:hypothetical protein